MTKLTQQLQAAQTAVAATRARLEGLREAGDTSGLPAAETAFVNARSELRRLEAAADAAAHKQTGLARARRLDAFNDAQAAIGRDQQRVLGLLRAYRDELAELEAKDQVLIAEHRDLLGEGETFRTAEQRWRWRAGEPEQIVAEKVVERWVGPNGLPLGPEADAQIEVIGDGRRGTFKTRMQDAPVARLPCKEVTFRPAVAAYEPPPLLSAISLPPLDPAPSAERKPQVKVVRDTGLRVVKPAAA